MLPLHPPSPKGTPIHPRLGKSGAFWAVLCNVVDLDQLRDQLVAVVQETIQPSSVSLWLIKSERGANREAWGVHPLYARAEK
jgi:hypothetical protein